ncbi:MAG: hypothetical protein ACI35S_03460 [Anaeroplasma sp.]
MTKKSIKNSELIISKYSIFSLIRNILLKIPSIIFSNNIEVLSNEKRDGASDSGFILFRLNSKFRLN